MIITTKQVKQSIVNLKKSNAQDWAKEYTVNFLESGLVSYEDVGSGIAMLRKETILKMLQSFIGKPVVIDHIDVTPKDYKDHAVGYVTRVWFDDYSGWAYCAFILTDDKAKEKVAKGYSVSCAYDVISTGKGGEWHAIKYDEEITDGSFTHLALVTSPRYEDCRILVNSKKATIKPIENKKFIVTLKDGEEKEIEVFTSDTDKVKQIADTKYPGNKGVKEKKENTTHFTAELTINKNQQKEDSKMIQLFRKTNDKAGAEVDPKDPTKQKWNAEGIFVQIENEFIPLSELAKHAKLNEFVPLEGVENEVEINGTMHNVSDLVANYTASKKANADDEEKKKKEEEEKKNAEDKAKENETDEDKKKRMAKEEEEKKNAEEKDKEEKKDAQEKEEETIKRNAKKDGMKHFIKLNTAKENGVDTTSMIIDTMHNRIDRGAEKYGSAKTGTV